MASTEKQDMKVADTLSDHTARGADIPTGIASAVPAVFALVGVVIFCVWTQHDGGFAPEQWLPGALVMLGLLVSSLASDSVRSNLRSARSPVLLFGLYTMWSYASIIWAQVRGDAVDGANRTLLYFCVFALFVGLPLSERLRVVLISAWGATIAVIGCVALRAAATASHPMGHFVQGRFASPISYPDANVAVLLMAFLSLLVIASRRETPLLLRTIAGAASSILVDLGLLGQSRGSLFALPLTLILLLIVSRNPLRFLGHLVVVAVAAAPAVPDLLYVYSAVVNGGEYTTALRTASLWVGGSGLIAAAGFAAVAVVDRRVRVPEATCARLQRGLVMIAAAVVAAGLVALLGFGHPLTRARTAWHDFTTNKAATAQTFHLTSGLGTSRYDVWRIALDQFANHPVGGVGADNYIVGYLQQRRTGETSRYPESTELRALSETGLVGGVLLAGFLLLASRRAILAARRTVMPNAALACLAAFGYWFFHSSVDWFWEFPALTAPALMFLGLAGASLAEVQSEQPGRALHGRVVRLSSRAGVSALAVGAAAVLLLPWLSVRQTDSAVAVARSDPTRAYELLHDAGRLNPFSETPPLAEATLAANAGDRALERRALLAALRRNRWDWYAYMMLGIVAGREHHLTAAHAYIAHARRLSPLDQVALYAQNRLNEGAPLTEREIGQVLQVETRSLRGVTQR